MMGEMMKMTFVALVMWLGLHVTAQAAPMAADALAEGQPGDPLDAVVESYRPADPPLSLGMAGQEAQGRRSQPGERVTLTHQLVREANLTQVPELDPEAGHAGLALLLGAVAVVFGGRRRG